MKVGRSTLRIDEKTLGGFRKELLAIVRTIDTAADIGQTREALAAVAGYKRRFDDFVRLSLWPQLVRVMEEHDVRSAWEPKLQRAVGALSSVLVRTPSLREDIATSEEDAFDMFRGSRHHWIESTKRAARDMWGTLDKFIAALGSLDIPVAEKELHEIAGFKVRVDTFDENPDSVREQLQRLDHTLREYRKRAAAVLPWLVQNALPFVATFKRSGGMLASYERSYVEIYANLLQGDLRDVQTVAHEMGHHLYYTYLSDDAVTAWRATVSADATDLDLEAVLRRWPENIEWLHRWTQQELRREDPILAVQLMAIDNQYQDFGGTRDEVAAFAKKHPVVKVPKTPITGYGSTNASEGFAEVVGMLVAYGPRSVHPLVRAWFDIVVPGARTASLATRVAHRYVVGR